jgi:sugar lactone lactonase YvrE
MITGVYLKYPFRVRLSDSSLYVMDIHPQDYYCYEFDYPSMKFKRSLIKRGQAPNEFLDAENIRIDNKGGLWLLDANRKKIVNFEHEKPSSPPKTFPLNEDLIRT